MLYAHYEKSNGFIHLVFSSHMPLYNSKFNSTDFDLIKKLADVYKQIPAGLRSYDPMIKMWTFDENTACLLLTGMILATQHKGKPSGKAPQFMWEHPFLTDWMFPQDENFFEDGETNWTQQKAKVKAEAAEDFFEKPVTQIPSVTIEATLRKLLELKPTEEITRKLYLQGVRKHHPDLGGDPKIMSELNQMWTLYQETKIK
jgi:hypothetical protein